MEEQNILYFLGYEKIENDLLKDNLTLLYENLQLYGKNVFVYTYDILKSNLVIESLKDSDEDDDDNDISFNNYKNSINTMKILMINKMKECNFNQLQIDEIEAIKNHVKTLKEQEKILQNKNKSEFTIKMENFIEENKFTGARKQFLLNIIPLIEKGELSSELMIVNAIDGKNPEKLFSKDNQFDVVISFVLNENKIILQKIKEKEEEAIEEAKKLKQFIPTSTNSKKDFDAKQISLF